MLMFFVPGFQLPQIVMLAAQLLHSHLREDRAALGVTEPAGGSARPPRPGAGSGRSAPPQRASSAGGQVWGGGRLCFPSLS